MAYHARHAGEWVVRLGDGTDESHERAASALDELWPYTHELFMADDVDRAVAAAGILPDPAGLREPWLEEVDAVLERATLARPADGWRPEGGRRGVHTEHLSYVSWPRCRCCRARFRERRGERGDCRERGRPGLGCAGPGDGPGDPGDLGGRSRHRARGARNRRWPRGGDHADLFGVSGDAPDRAGYPRGAGGRRIAARLSIVLSPAWTTDWISEAGREKLEATGSRRRSARPASGRCSAPAAGGVPAVRVGETEMISEFGSTPCKALWRCTQCREPFDYFKCI
jgi:hypothetical protein